ncbi:MAG: nicotinamide riboside transporter PnuC, partial [Prevotella sp.]
GMSIYYTLAAIYGYLVWKFGKKRGQQPEEEMPVTHYPKRLIVPALVVWLAAWAAVWFILVKFTNSNVPVTDSFVNSLSFIGLWALARKYLEQWLIWIVVDAVSAVLYVYKGIPFMASLYALYVVIAIFGYRKWRQMMR